MTLSCLAVKNSLSNFGKFGLKDQAQHHRRRRCPRCLEPDLGHAHWWFVLGGIGRVRWIGPRYGWIVDTDFVGGRKEDLRLGRSMKKSVAHICVA